MSSRTTQPPDPRRRIIALLGLFCVIAIGYVVSLLDLQAFRPEKYRDIGEDQRTRSVALEGYRGTIFDREGNVLAASTPGQQLVVDPQLVADADATAAVLAPALGVDAAELREHLVASNENDHYGLLVDLLDDDALARFLALRESSDTADLVAGVEVVSTEERVYPAGTLARPIVGRREASGDHALFGMELQFEDELAGVAGVENYERSVFGMISVGERSVVPASPGSDVHLTIDQNIQYVVEELLIEHCEMTLAASAQSVVSDPRTGEILAMATVVRDDDGGCSVPRYNAPLIDQFEPGSVLKMVTAAAAVEDLGYTSDTTFAVPNSVVVADREFVEPHEHEVAPYPVAQMIAQSMNVGAIMMAQEVGAERLHWYLDAFGFGQSTGLGFEHETSGLLRPVDEWYGSDIGSISFGQGMTANTVQLAMAYNTIANDGVYLSPSLVRTVTNADGTEQPQEAQISRRVVSEAAANEVTTMLEAVVRPDGVGTGTAAAVPGYAVAGKTGTAWKVFEQPDGSFGYGSVGNREYVVTFAGFLPADDPQLSIVVVVDEPETETSAGLVAAPVFADIAHYVVRILGIAPEGAELVSEEPVRGTPAGFTDTETAGQSNPAMAVADDAPVDGSTIQDETGQDETGEDETGEDETGEDETGEGGGAPAGDETDTEGG